MILTQNQKISVDNPEYCALYLNAVANPQEQVTTQKWDGRSTLSAELFARLTTEQSSGPDAIMQLPMTQLNGNGRIELGYLSNYSIKNPSWGKTLYICGFFSFDCEPDIEVN